MIGIFVCIAGTILIVNNERADKVSLNEGLYGFSDTDIIIGSVFGVVSTLFLTFICFGAKVLVNDRISNHIVAFYTGFFNILFAGIYCLYNLELAFDWKYTLYIFSNGLLFYIALWLFNAGLKYVTNSQISALGYLSIIIIFVLGFILLGESIFITDIIGSLLILSYNWFKLHTQETLIVYDDQDRTKAFNK